MKELAFAKQTVSIEDSVLYKPMKEEFAHTLWSYVMLLV